MDCRRRDLPSRAARRRRISDALRPYAARNHRARANGRDETPPPRTHAEFACHARGCSCRENCALRRAPAALMSRSFRGNRRATRPVQRGLNSLRPRCAAGNRSPQSSRRSTPPCGGSASKAVPICCWLGARDARRARGRGNRCAPARTDFAIARSSCARCCADRAPPQPQPRCVGNQSRQWRSPAPPEFGASTSRIANRPV